MLKNDFWNSNHIEFKQGANIFKYIRAYDYLTLKHRKMEEKRRKKRENDDDL